MQLRHLRDQSRQLESQLCKMQHDMISKEQDLSILHTRLQQMNPEDPQYVCANVLNSHSFYFCNSQSLPIRSVLLYYNILPVFY